MEKLKKGKFFGNSRNEFHINGLTIVDSEFYHYTNCPWHYHQNAHFAFTTKGHLVETHKKREIQLSAGSLLYNHSQDPHCNSRYSEHVAALHVDIDVRWFSKYNINFLQIEGVREIKDTVQKNIFHHLFKEARCFDSASPLAIEAMILQSVSELNRTDHLLTTAKPSWVIKIRDLLYDRYSEPLSLQEVALDMNLHPVYLCQKFPFYFNCSFGDYIRKIRIEKAVELIFNKPHLSLTKIAYSCGFSDQSHFTRLFRKHIGITPSAFSRLTRRT
jgi:AraC family transcriptional regulator